MGDVLSFKFNSKIGKLIIKKNNYRKLYEMDIEKNAAEKYAVCAYLYSSGDSIELID